MLLPVNVQHKIDIFLQAMFRAILAARGFSKQRIKAAMSSEPGANELDERYWFLSGPIAQRAALECHSSSSTRDQQELAKAREIDIITSDIRQDQLKNAVQYITLLPHHLGVMPNEIARHQIRTCCWGLSQVSQHTIQMPGRPGFRYTPFSVICVYPEYSYSRTSFRAKGITWACV